jgi:DNA-binding NarL/FixJ family response regulator
MASSHRIDGSRKVSAVGILVVEDFEPMRRFICLTLDRNPELQVIGEVADGMEGVRKAKELQPNLILLDVGLPILNGVEAARLIRTLSPKSKIIFVTQESSADIVQEAISLGAWGYVMKTRVASDLLAAIQAVCEGKPFVGGELWFQNLAEVHPQPTGIKQP